MKLTQFELFVADIARADGERQAAAILAANIGANGKKQDVERAIRDLTEQKQKSMSIEEAQAVANARKPR